MKRIALICAGLCLTSCVGCHASPNVEIIGSYFPAWMLSLVIAVVATVTIHLVARARGAEEWFEPGVVIYSSITIILTCLIWLVVFA